MFVNRARGTGSQVFNVLKETGNRIVGVPDVVMYGGRIRLYKQLQMRVVILRDERGAPLATEAEVWPSVRETQRVFALAARVRVVPAGQFIVTEPEPAPTAALDVHCDDGAWQEDFAVAGAYFRKRQARGWLDVLVGHRTPVTVFIVRDISLKGGCSLGPLTDYVTLEAGMLPRAQHRIMAHEVAHACGLFHSKTKANLMFPRGPGDQLEGWQRAILRNSRHVAYL